MASALSVRSCTELARDAGGGGLGVEMGGGEGGSGLVGHMSISDS